ncbi:hypothetical protein Fot_06831 [Forsythia ovata]|uniref:Uncharacterized protein n=1 Tax=Forsythia ovata TaxID=205694 RepID=A0ABD1WU38_9LAMI
MMRMWRILERLSDAGRLLLRGLRTLFPTIEERLEPLFLLLLLLVSPNELDPVVLEKLPAPAAIAAASIHKSWTSTFEKVADNAELMKLLKLAEMYTSRSHVLNCELYKVLVMKVDKLRSTIGGAQISTLCLQRTRSSVRNSPFSKMPRHGLYTT